MNSTPRVAPRREGGGEHKCKPIQMGTPVSRTVCAYCGHDEGCTRHGGEKPCNGWHGSPCKP